MTKDYIKGGLLVDTLHEAFPDYDLTVQDGIIDIEALIKKHLGWWSDRNHGLVHFNTQGHAEAFAAELAGMKAPDDGGDPSPEYVQGQKTIHMEDPRPARAPVNLHSLSQIERAVERAKHAKRAKEYLKPTGAKQNVINHAKLKLDWGSDSNHEAAMVYLKEAFEEYLPAIFDVALKKAEEADRAARDALVQWGPKA